MGDFPALSIHLFRASLAGNFEACRRYAASRYFDVAIARITGTSREAFEQGHGKLFVHYDPDFEGLQGFAPFDELLRPDAKQASRQ